MIQDIPLVRLISYFLSLCFVLLLLLGLHEMNELSELRSLGHEIRLVDHDILSANSKKAFNDSVREHFQGVDRDYLDKSLSALSLMEKERHFLQNAGKEAFLAHNSSAMERLQKLKHNCLLFHEEPMQRFDGIEESVIASDRTVEINQEDDGLVTQAILFKITEQKTVPNVFIGGKHIGGNSQLQQLAKSGELKGILDGHQISHSIN